MKLRRQCLTAQKVKKLEFLFLKNLRIFLETVVLVVAIHRLSICSFVFF